MKMVKSIRIFFIACSILCFYSANAQVSEIGLGFKKHGFVQEINAADNSIDILFITENSMSREKLLLKNPNTNQLVKGISDINELLYGMELVVDGDNFPKKKLNIANSITIIKPKQKFEIVRARLDDIKSEYAFVDGNRIKLKEGTKIYGEKKSPYKGKSFNSFKELKLGDYIDVKGSYNTEGYIEASEVKIAPDLETAMDQNLKNTSGEGGESLHDLMYNDWIDPIKRKKWFGKQVEKNGFILASTVMQNYIQEFGMKLVPEYAKEKIKFMFVVIDKDYWNATAQPDGLVLVYTGLLKDIENEAQLAAVLAHEITHAAYEHIANEIEAKNSEVKKKKNRLNIISGVMAVANTFIPNEYKPTRANRNTGLGLTVDTVSQLLLQTSIVASRKKFSEYNVNQETQADRVGLSFVVKNGYDPREAQVVWQLMYNKEAEEKIKQENIKKQQNSNNDFSKYTPDETNIILKQMTITTKTPTIVDFTAEFLKRKAKQKIITTNIASEQTHPDYLTRVSDFNKLVEMYYSAGSLIEKTKTGEKEFADIMLEADADIRKFTNEIEEKNKIAVEKRKKLDESFIKVYKVMNEKVTEKSTTALTYKGYKMQSCIDIYKIIGKPNCNKSDYEEVLKKIHNTYFVTISEFVTKFKNGDLDPKSKNVFFAFNYSLANSYNQFAVLLATLINIGDVERLNGLKEIINKNEMNKFITVDEEDVLQIGRYLDEH